MLRLLVKTFKGLENVLAAELRSLGAEQIQIVSRGVICTGPPRLLYRANLELRTGLRVYRFLSDFDASDADSLYSDIIDYEWEKHLDKAGTLFVTSTAFDTDWVRNTMFVAQRAKDAIVDRLRRGETRPQVTKDRPDLLLHVYIHKGKGSLWQDSSGDPLFKRGNRIRSVEAPLNEVLAAGILALTDQNRETPFVDPMCGSATIAIEAAKRSLKIPSQIERRYFAFMAWPDFDPEQWEVLRQQARARMDLSACAPIIASDLDFRAIRAADQNIRESGLRKWIELHEASFFRVSAPFQEGLVLFNPPYDERLPLEDANLFYRDLGEALAYEWPGWKAWLLTAHLRGLELIEHQIEQRGGKPLEPVFELDNGGIDVELRGFAIAS